MKKFYSGIMIVAAFAFFPVKAFCVWNPNDIQTSQDEILKVTVSSLADHGVVFQKYKSKQNTAFLITYFAGNRTYKRRFLPRSVFLKKYDEFRKLFQEALKVRPSVANCRNSVKVERQVDRGPASYTRLCNSDLTLKTEKKLEHWFLELNSY